MAKDNKTISRRDFIKGAAVGAAGVSVFGLMAACTPTEAPVAAVETPADTATPTPEPAPAPVAQENTVFGVISGAADETVEVDIAVVGSGLGGFAAAMTAIEEGASKVALLEKNGFYGGSTLFAECNGPGEYTEEQARAAAISAVTNTGYIAEPMLHYNMKIDYKADTDWLFTTHEVKTYRDGGPSFYEGGNGTSCIKTLSEQAEKMEGLDMRLNSRAIGLLMGDDYTCTGVRIEEDGGKTIDFKAKAVVLATGGMSTNKELLAQYSSIDMEKVIGWGAGQDGDGQLMVEQTAHGRANHLCVASLFNNVKDFAYDSPLGVCVAMQPTNLYVNQDAIRFVSEAIRGTAESGKMVETQGSVYSILDKDHIEKYANGGASRHYSGFADELVGKPVTVLNDEIEKYKDLPDVFIADTLEELAAKMGVDPATFVATVEKYNSYEAGGVDTEWGKPVENIWPVATAPFYGFRLSSGMLNTCGGIRINTNAQVVDARFKPITGLYAAGVCTSGWDGEVYGGGTCQSVALWAGRKSVKHAIANLL